MANADPSRTELPTPKRIEDARKEGQVLTSEEISSVVAVAVGALLLLPTIPLVRKGFGTFYQYCLVEGDSRAAWSIADLERLTAVTVGHCAIMALPILAGVTIAAVICGRAQVGNYLEIGALAWKFDQLNPVEGCKRVLPTWDNIARLLLVLAKLGVVVGLVWMMVRHQLDAIVWLPLRGLAGGVGWLFGQVASLTAAILLLLAALAVLDYLHRRKQYLDKLMMTKQEVKEEHRNADGDPHIKARIRARMRELTMMRLITEVPKADVVVTNPVRVAVALRYQPGEAAPIVVAKGLRKRALRIRQIAHDAGVPIIEAPPVARALYRTAVTGGFIPPHLYNAVAAILAQVFRHRRHRSSAVNLNLAGGTR